MITVATFAARHHLTPDTIRKRCQAGTIPGAKKIGRDWLIPELASMPADKRTKAYRSHNPSLEPVFNGSLPAEEPHIALFL